MAGKQFNHIKDIPDLGGRVILVTGGTGGLGAQCIEYLAPHNPAHIYFTGRNKSRADALINKVKAYAPNTRLTYIECDFKSLASVQTASKDFLSKSDRLDILICNAGIMTVPAELTTDGYEIQFQVNHLSHALMIKLLLPVLKQTAAQPSADVRIINLSSVAYNQAPTNGIQFDGLKTRQKYLGWPIGPGWKRYGQSKLANLLYPAQITAHHPEIMAVSVHPGVITSTDLFANTDFLSRLPALVMNYGKTCTIEEGALNQTWAATCPRSDLKAGTYYLPVGIPEEPLRTKYAQDTKLGAELWEWTQKELASWS